MAHTNSGWPTNIPAGSDALNTADDQLRRLRLDTKERMNDIVDDWTADPIVRKTLDVSRIVGDPDLAVVYTNAAFSLPSGATTIIDFVAETLDTGNPTTEFHSNSVNPSRLTITTAAYYRITASIQVTSSTNKDSASFHLKKNGVTIASTRTLFDGVDFTNQMFVTYIDLAAATDYYEISVFQDSSDAWATLDIASKAYFMIERIAGTT